MESWNFVFETHSTQQNNINIQTDFGGSRRVVEQDRKVYKVILAICAAALFGATLWGIMGRCSRRKFLFSDWV